ncbi:MAG: HAD family phosphatase [Candidatus Marinimicrobia bacterium]|nr:HAD family phosphatase [Candidatus Neomarinimicrobiota bacterium]
MNNNINTIFFDLFGVLLGVDQSVVIQYLSNLTDTPYLETREIAMGEPFMKLERGEINFNEYVKRVRILLPNGGRIDGEVLRDIWMNSKIGEMPAVSLLDDLLIKYGVWVISNTTESHIGNLKSKFEFLNSCNGIITSERAGAHKPHPNIFKFALAEAGADADVSIFIDDSYSNIEGAENLGIISHHYTEFDGFTRFLSIQKIIINTNDFQN